MRAAGVGFNGATYMQNLLIKPEKKEKPISGRDGASSGSVLSDAAHCEIYCAPRSSQKQLEYASRVLIADHSMLQQLPEQLSVLRTAGSPEADLCPRSAPLVEQMQIEALPNPAKMFPGHEPADNAKTFPRLQVKMQISQ